MASLPDPLVKPIRPASVEGGGLAALLQYEAQVRRWPTVPELVYYLANDTRRIVSYEQLFVLRHSRVTERFQVIAASSIPIVDRNAPLIQAVENSVAKLARSGGLVEPRDVDAVALMGSETLEDYPFTQWRWQPLKDAEGSVFAGVLTAGRGYMRASDADRLARVCETVAHSWRALTGDRPVQRIRRPDRKERRALLVAATVVLLFPVQLTALAPVEVVAARPFVVAAPFSGVIDRILVPPNAGVKAGQPLVRFDDTKLRNDLEIAAEKLQVARTRVERSTNLAIDVREEAREITLTRAEQQVAKADFEYAQDLLSRAQLKAPQSGTALYTDRRDWEGRAVNVGDPILQIVDPGDVEFRIDLPTREQMSLETGSRVKVWLDAQPLWALDGKLETVSYQARPTADDILAFAVLARPVGATPRVGSRGTAKVYGNWVPLIYSLLRRPIASARQFVGL